MASNTQSVMEYLKRGSIWPKNGRNPIEILVGVTQLSRSEVLMTLSELVDQGKVVYEGPLSCPSHIGIPKTVFSQSDEARRQSRHATTADGRHLPGTLYDSMVTPVVVRKMTAEDYRDRGLEVPAELQEEIVSDNTNEVFEEPIANDPSSNFEGSYQVTSYMDQRSIEEDPVLLILEHLGEWSSRPNRRRQQWARFATAYHVLATMSQGSWITSKESKATIIRDHGYSIGTYDRAFRELFQAGLVAYRKEGFQGQNQMKAFMITSFVDGLRQSVTVRSAKWHSLSKVEKLQLLLDIYYVFSLADVPYRSWRGIAERYIEVGIEVRLWRYFNQLNCELGLIEFDRSGSGPKRIVSVRHIKLSESEVAAAVAQVDGRNDSTVMTDDDSGRSESESDTTIPDVSASNPESTTVTYTELADIVLKQDSIIEKLRAELAESEQIRLQLTQQLDIGRQVQTDSRLSEILSKYRD